MLRHMINIKGVTIIIPIKSVVNQETKNIMLLLIVIIAAKPHNKAEITAAIRNFSTLPISVNAKGKPPKYLSRNITANASNMLIMVMTVEI